MLGELLELVVFVLLAAGIVIGYGQPGRQLLRLTRLESLRSRLANGS